MAGIRQDHGNKKLTVHLNLKGHPFLSVMNLNLSQTFIGVLIRLDDGGVWIYMYMRIRLWISMWGCSNRGQI
jgi:hypothetical protein